ncbi:MAG: ABC transporter permease [Chthoniobacteraceae bacterium]
MHPLIQQHWRRAAFEAALVAAVLVALFAVLLAPSPDGGSAGSFFWTADNARFVAIEALSVSLGALGMALVLLVGGIDLSAGGCAVLAGVVAAALLGRGTPVFPALGCALLAGGALGALNGTLVGFARTAAAPWLITLGTFGIARGAAHWIAGEDTADIPLAASNTLRGLNLAPGLLLVALLTAGLAVLLRVTVFGRHLRAIGSNEEAARLCGVRVRLTKGLVYTAAGCLFALAGLAGMAVAGHGSTRAALGLEIAYVAAALWGGLRLGGGSGGVCGAFIGALGVTALMNAVQQAGWPVPLQEIAMGGLLIAAVGIDRLRQRPTCP